MTTDATLLSTVLDLLSGMGVLRQRKMFGGVYIYCDDLFIATIHGSTLYFKANANTAADFVTRGLPIFSYLKEVDHLLSYTFSHVVWMDKYCVNLSDFDINHAAANNLIVICCRVEMFFYGIYEIL